VLDAAQGTPAGGLVLALYKQSPGAQDVWERIAGGVTNADGRVPSLLPASDYVAPGRCLGGMLPLLCRLAGCKAAAAAAASLVLVLVLVLALHLAAAWVLQEATCCADPPPPSTHTHWRCRYQMRFHSGAYLQACKQRHPAFYHGVPFYPTAVIEFEIAPDMVHDHFHIPLLLSPYSYSTYRGS
jgi:5-hydroxyisourate hydrolase-like protein (transthyretin family)